MSTILYVEDDEGNVSMKRGRPTRTGFTVIVAPDGERGVAMAALSLAKLDATEQHDMSPRWSLHVVRPLGEMALDLVQHVIPGPPSGAGSSPLRLRRLGCRRPSPGGQFHTGRLPSRPRAPSKSPTLKDFPHCSKPAQLMLEIPRDTR